MIEVPKVGEIWTPWYPSHNRLGMPIEFVPRRFFVCGILDFSKRFLSIAHFMKRPMVRRGPLLAVVDDEDLLESRLIYLHATPDNDLPLLKIACLDSDDNVIDWLGRPYEPTFFDRCEMMATIAAWQKQNARCGLHLGIAYGEAA